MVQAQERKELSIDRVGRSAFGYDTNQVDQFLNHAHELYEQDSDDLRYLDTSNAAFTLRKNGYAIDQVDAALARLQQVVADKNTAWQLQYEGDDAWRRQTYQMYQAIAKVASRQELRRFKPGNMSTVSYDRKQVDSFIDDVMLHFDDLLGMNNVSEQDAQAVSKLSVKTINNVLFTQRKGKRGYDEHCVDFFLSQCALLLSRIESYERFDDSVLIAAHSQVDASGSNNAYDAASAGNASLASLASLAVNPTIHQSNETQAVPSLFDSQHHGAHAAQYAASHNGQVQGSPDDAFDELQRAEQAIFSAPKATTFPAVSSSPSETTSNTVTYDQAPSFAPSFSRHNAHAAGTAHDANAATEPGEHTGHDALPSHDSAHHDGATPENGSQQHREHGDHDVQGEHGTTAASLERSENNQPSVDLEATQSFDPISDYSQPQAPSYGNANLFSQGQHNSHEGQGAQAAHTASVNAGDGASQGADLSSSDSESPDSFDASASSSLAALTRMAQSLHEMYPTQTESFSVSIPTLQPPVVKNTNFDDLGDEPTADVVS